MQLDGIAVAGYRSFGAELQKVAPLNKINLLAGQNNSGKSNVLRFMHDRLPALLPNAIGRSQKPSIDPLDEHRPTNPRLRFAIGTRIDGTQYQAILAALPEHGRSKEAFAELSGSLADEAGTIWWPFITDVGQRNVSSPDVEAFQSAINADQHRRQWEEIGITVTNLARNNRVGAYVDGLFQWVVREHLRVPPTVMIPAVRQIGVSPTSEEGDLTGADLIQRLAELQNPSIHEQHKKRQFAAINEFIRAVTGDAQAAIEIPGQRDTVHVHLGTQVFPLENLGTGIHEVTMLAAWSTIFENHVVCLEEPEIHLHPLLQRKLLNYIAEQTSNQYVITTHSAHFLDQPGASAFHVRWDGDQTEVSFAISPSQRVELCADLGYRASDLLQSNAIIWVEGPSDRLYIRHWLTAFDQELIEGVHYSVMFYGGRLLSHLTADDVEIDDFISLRQINQWLAIVIDSDRHSRGERLNATKRRVQGEFDTGRGFAWITEGREIENYISGGVLQAAISKTHPNARTVEPTNDRYADVATINVGDRSRSIDKVKVAHHVVDQDPDLSILDLRKQLSRLAAFVREANGIAG